MIRVQQGSTPTITHTFTSGGVPAIATNPQVRIVDSTGAEVVALSAASGPVNGAYSFQLPAGATARLGTLTATWTGTIAGVAQSDADSVEVVNTVAFDALARMTAATSNPILSDDDLIELVRLAQRRDRFGLLPTDAGWTSTYELNAAAAEGWRWKAGRVAEAYSYMVDRQRVDRSDMHAHCMAMADMYRKRIGTSARDLSPTVAGHPSLVDYAETPGV